MAYFKNTIVAALLLLVLAYSEAESSDVKNDINVTFWRLMEKFVFPGEPISFRTEVYNDGAKYTTLLKWKTPLDHHDSRPLSDIFKVLFNPCDKWNLETHTWCESKQKPEELVYMGIRTKKGNPARSSYANLKPGSVTHQNIDLTELYDFSKLGHYSIELDTNIIDGVKHWNTDHKINNRVFSNFTTTLEPLPSNILQFEVFDNNGFGRKDPTKPNEKPKPLQKYDYEISPRIPIHDEKYPSTWKLQELKLASTCTEDQVKRIQDVSRELLKKIESVSKLPRDTTNNHLKKWFGGNEDFEEVDKRLRAIANFLTNPETSNLISWNCGPRSEPICGKDTISFSSARYNQVTLCSRFFEDSEEKYDTPHGILLHEISHLLLNLKDTAQTDKQCQAIPSEKKRSNANNLQFYFEDLARIADKNAAKDRTEF